MLRNIKGLTAGRRAIEELLKIACSRPDSPGGEKRLSQS
jgi:hypothetical protein